MTWVRFHGELRFGEKRGLSRATRFIYLELSHEARPKKGIIILPKGMSDTEAAIEILGGNRREVITAINDLSEPPDPMISFGDYQGKRALIVTSWQKWNPATDDGARRVRDWRAGKKQRDGVPDSDVTCNVTSDNTGSTTSTAQDGTVTSTSARARANLLSSSEDSSLPSTSFSGSEIQDCDERAESPSGVRLRSRQVNVTADGAMGLVVAAWAEGVRAGNGGRPFVEPRGGEELARLLDALDEHCPHGRMTQARLDWARDSGRAYGAEAKRLGGWAYADWLNNAGRTAPAEPKPPAYTRLPPLVRPGRP